jgi:hypothetical protein
MFASSIFCDNLNDCEDNPRGAPHQDWYQHMQVVGIPKVLLVVTEPGY